MERHIEAPHSGLQVEIQNRAIDYGHHARVIILLLFCVTGTAHPQTTTSDGPVMTGVHDVLSGQRVMLKEDDIMLLDMNTADQNSGLITLDTKSSNFQPQTNGPNFGSINSYGPGSIPGSTASGRMYNSSSDVVVTVTPNFPDWFANLWDPATKSMQELQISSALEADGYKVFSRVAMGNFKGDGFSEALVFVESAFDGYELWGMNILAVSAVNTVDSALMQGPQISGCAGCQGGPTTLPVLGSIVVGDFNGDGKDEIAALLSDYETVQFYNVDPNTLAITQTASLKLPQPISSASTLAAGRFRNNANVELAVIGQTAGSYDVTIYSIQTVQMQNNVNVFDPAVVQTTSVATNYYVPNTPINGVLAEAAPILNWPQPTLEQLVIGIQYVPPQSWSTGFVWIGSFDSAFSFHLNESDDDLQENGCLLGMQVGNFDNQNGGAHNPNLQIALFENIGSGGAACQPNFNGGYLWVKIMNINLPNSPYDPTNPPPPTNWLAQASSVELNLPSGYDAIQSIALITGDLQGRSLLLGPPEKITITNQVQPDIILGMPPMHVDYIVPIGLGKSYCSSIQAPTGECVLNLTVEPNASSPNPAFNSTYRFEDGSTVSSSKKSATSWGLSTKIQAGVKIKYATPEVTEKLQITSTTSDAYTNSVSHYNQQYTGISGQLTESTVFADHIIFSAATQNIYYYPILGQIDSAGNQVYAVFSVPSNVASNDVDATSQEWYQPVQEPGNVLSYPWSQALLQQRFPNSAQILGSSSCQDTSDANGSYVSSWAQGTSQTHTSGWSDSLSSDLDISYSYQVGKEILGEGGYVKVFGDIDIAGSSSWSTLNTTTQTLTSSEGIQVNRPPFDSNIANQAGYGFKSYILSLTNPNASSSNPDLQSDGTYQGLSSTLSTDIKTTGPLVLGFIASPLTSTSDAGCGGGNLWTQAYTKPDISLNHPARWDWSNTTYTVKFNNFVTPSYSFPLIDQDFYKMKGLFITPQAQLGDPTSTGATIGSANAGDQITLTARIYNYSLTATNENPPYTNSVIHVRFYGQKKCSVNYSGGTVTDLCPDRAFLIPGKGNADGDVLISSIPGFGESDEPNWALASVNFDTTGYDDTELVFWVVVWLSDANGNVLPEMTGHGLTTSGTLAGKAFKNISDVPVDIYSNNVGMYGWHTPFYVRPVNTGLAGARSPSGSVSAALDSLSLSLPTRKLLLDEKARVTATFTAGSNPVDAATVSYYDGDPSKGGKLFDAQVVRELAADTSASEYLSFRPQTCGRHTIFGVAQAEGFPATIGKVYAFVTIDAVSSVQSLIEATKKAKLPEETQEGLVETLKAAGRFFRVGHEQAGDEMISQYIRRLSKQNKRERIDPSIANRLIGQAQPIVTCIADSLRHDQEGEDLVQAKTPAPQ